MYGRKFLLRQVRQNTFSRSVENNVKSKGGEGLCQTYSIAFLVSGCREPIGNQLWVISLCYTRTNVPFFDLTKRLKLGSKNGTFVRVT